MDLIFRFWVRPYLRKRQRLGAMQNQFHHLFQQSETEFKSFLRLSKTQFHEVLSLIENDISSDRSTSREGISAKEKFMVTLRYLAGGESHSTLSLYFMIGRPTISKFIPKVLQAIIRRLGPIYGRVPDSERDWLDIERRFAHRWDYINTIGAIDGKHVIMIKPRKSGSTFYNYKQTFSINLMGIVGADYQFLAYDIGSPGRMSDSGIWNRSPLKPMFEPSSSNNPLKIPKPHTLVSPLNNVETGQHALNYHLIGDDGFGLSVHLMKPYNGANLSASQLIFNYRLSRARQVVEVAFGILANRFRCLINRLHCSPVNAKLIVEGAVVLHNYLIYQKPIGEKEAGVAKSLWCRDFKSSNHRNYSSASGSATEMRDYLKEFFLSAYPIDSQYDTM